MKFSKYLLLVLLAVIVLKAFPGFSKLKTLGNERRRSERIACPSIDISNVIIKPSGCSKDDGSITGIKITSSGTKILYTWRNSAGITVAHSVDLIGIPADTYTLEVTDNSGCTTLTSSPPLAVKNTNGINLDDSRVVITDADCNKNGAITGIKVTGATIYEWHDLTTNTIVSTSTKTADLTGVAPGRYQLYTSNSTCEQTSRPYMVGSTLQLPTTAHAQIKSSECGASNGSIAVSLTAETSTAGLRWYFTDQAGNRLSFGTLGDITNPVVTYSKADEGTYYLYVTNNNSSCTVLIGTYVLGTSDLSVSKTDTKVTNDRCNQHLAYIVPAFVNGIPSRTWTFEWTDLTTGQVIGKTKTLIKIGAGRYRLRAKAGEGCIADSTFTITNVSPALIPPTAAGSTICLPGMINITVTNPDTAAIFKLYDSPANSIPIDSNKTGVFYKQVDQTTDFYVTRVHKDCESDRTKVTETVVVSIKIPNAFTPNSDGINDTWNIAGINKFPGADVKIFTRYGKLIFHSINYPVDFNGTYNGSRVPPGVYYYIIDVKQPICYGKISGSLTIIY